MAETDDILTYGGSLADLQHVLEQTFAGSFVSAGEGSNPSLLLTENTVVRVGANPLVDDPEDELAAYPHWVEVEHLDGDLEAQMAAARGVFRVLQRADLKLVFMHDMAHEIDRHDPDSS